MLQKKAADAKREKSLKQQIWVLKHPKLVAAGEATRGGLGRLSSGASEAWKAMKAKELVQKKAQKGNPKPKGNYADQINKAFGGY